MCLVHVRVVNAVLARMCFRVGGKYCAISKLASVNLYPVSVFYLDDGKSVTRSCVATVSTSRNTVKS